MSESGSVASLEKSEQSPAQQDTGSSAMESVGRQTLIYGLGIIANKGIAFIMLPVYTRFLTPADYGVLELIEMTLELISILAGAQLALGVFRFYHKAQTVAEKNTVVSTALFALVFSYAVVGVAGFLGAPLLSRLVFATADHADLLRIASASLALESLLIVPFAHARAKDRSVYYVVVSVVRALLALGLNLILLVGLGLGLKSMLLSSLVTNVVLGLWLSSGMIREVGFGVSKRVIKDLFRYGGPLVATQIATFVVTFGDRYFLQAAANPTVVGLYSLAYQFGFMVALFGAMPFMRVWDPKRFSVVDRPDRDDIYARGFIYLNVLQITVALVAVVMINDVLRIMTTPPFYGAGKVVPILAVAFVLQSWGHIQDTGILIRERTEFVMLANWLAAGTGLAGYALLIPRYLAWGAAGATVIAFLVRYLTLYIISQRLCRIKYRWGPVYRLIGLALLVYAVSAMLPPASLWTSVVTRMALLLAYAVAAWRLDILTQADRRYVREAVAAILARWQSGRKAAQNA